MLGWCELLLCFNSYSITREAEINLASHAFRPAHEHAWFNQHSTMELKTFAEDVQLSFAVVKHFAGRRIVDNDLLWIARFPTERMTADFGLSVGQANLLRAFAKRTTAHWGVD